MDDALVARLAATRTIEITTTGRRTGRPVRIEIWWFHVDGRFFSTFGVPTEEAFAMIRPPQGRLQFGVTNELAALAAETSPDANQAANLDAALRTELGRALAKEAQSKANR